jgi:hypothetical protein
MAAKPGLSKGKIRQRFWPGGETGENVSHRLFYHHPKNLSNAPYEPNV